MTIKTTKRLEELCSYRDEISRRLEELRMRYTKVLNSIDNEKLVIFQDQNVLPTEWEFVNWIIRMALSFVQETRTADHQTNNAGRK